MPRTRSVSLLVVAAIVLSTGGRWYRTRAQRNRQASVAQVPAKAQLTIPYLVYNRTPLAQVIADLRARSGVSISVDWDALRAAGVTPESPVEARLANVRWYKALTVAVESARRPGYTENVVYRVNDDGSVALLSARQFSRFAYFEIHDLRDLLDIIYANHGEPYRARLEGDVEALVTETVAPNSWMPQGGAYGICRLRHGWLLVHQTPENHRSISNLLEQLQETRGPPAAEREKQRLLSRLRGEIPSPQCGVPR